MREYLGAAANTDVEKLKETIERQNKLLAEKDAQIAALQKQVRRTESFRFGILVFLRKGFSDLPCLLMLGLYLWGFDGKAPARSVLTSSFSAFLFSSSRL